MKMKRLVCNCYLGTSSLLKMQWKMGPWEGFKCWLAFMSQSRRLIKERSR